MKENINNTNVQQTGVTAEYILLQDATAIKNQIKNIEINMEKQNHLLKTNERLGIFTAILLILILLKDNLK